MIVNVIKRVSKKTGYSEEQVNMVYRSFSEGLRFYLTNPFVSKGSVLIKGLGKFYMSHRSIEQEKKLTPELREYTQQFKRKKYEKRQKAG